MPLPKEPAPGENPGGFRSVLPAGEAGYDPRGPEPQRSTSDGPRWAPLSVEQMSNTAQREAEKLVGEHKPGWMKKR